MSDAAPSDTDARGDVDADPEGASATAATADRGPGASGDDRAVSLRLDGITKLFDDGGDGVVAVEDVTLDIYDGEFIVLVGPSGCGKTTTLRTIAGLESPTEGDVVIRDRVVNDLEPRERGVAMVFQNYALYPHKTVRDNVAFPLEIRKFPDEEVATRVEETAALLGITELLDRRPSELSGGQQQRVALGRAIVRDPELFLFDEPLSNLDAKLRIQMRTELNKLHDRVGKTSVYVTHDQVEAMTLSDRVVVMNEGRVQQVAPPEEVYARPANRFVAGFIGEPPMEFFDCTVVERDGRLLVETDGFALALPARAVAAYEAYDGPPDGLELGIRPEDIEDASLVEAPDEHCLDAVVLVVEPVGPARDLSLRPVGLADDDAAEFTARVSNDSDARSGDVVRLAVDVDEVHLFDRETGENILA